MLSMGIMIFYYGDIYGCDMTSEYNKFATKDVFMLHEMFKQDIFKG